MEEYGSFKGDFKRDKQHQNDANARGEVIPEHLEFGFWVKYGDVLGDCIERSNKSARIGSK